MVVLPGGISVTKNHPVRSPSAWIPAALVPGAKLEQREKFMTYGFLLNDPAACIMSPFYDLGSL